MPSQRADLLLGAVPAAASSFRQTLAAAARVRDRFRWIVTPADVVEVEVSDRFTEQIIDLHHAAIGRYFKGDEAHWLAAFAGIEIDGHELLSRPGDFSTGMRVAFAERLALEGQ